VESLTLAVKCTREEYMEFYARVDKKTALPTILGVIVLAAAVLLCVMDQTVHQHTLLLLLCGMLLVLTNPLILPTVRKGAAGRRYDNSDALKGALAVTVSRDSLTVRSACYEGCVPLSALTDILQTKTMTALVFGKELTVCIPMRALNAEETALFESILSTYKKEQV